MSVAAVVYAVVVAVDATRQLEGAHVSSIDSSSRERRRADGDGYESHVRSGTGLGELLEGTPASRSVVGTGHDGWSSAIQGPDNAGR